MKRIYSNYSNEDFTMIYDLAKELGFSLSAFQHYCVMLYADRKGISTPSNGLLSQLFNNMQKIEVGETFIVSALLPDVWPTLTRSVKMTLAKQLAMQVKKSPDFEPYQITKGKTTIYRRIS